MHTNHIHHGREIMLARICILATLALFAGAFWMIGRNLLQYYTQHHMRHVAEVAVFGIAMAFMLYGALVYQWCLVGYFKRRKKYRPAPRSALNALYRENAPALSVLIPAYKEEQSVIWQTMMSAALAESPKKNIVLLIDDPLRNISPEDARKLEHTRLIPQQLQRQFQEPFSRFDAEYRAFLERNHAGEAHTGIELNRLSVLYDDAAHWVRGVWQDFMSGRPVSALSHTDRFFSQAVLEASIANHHSTAESLRHYMISGAVIDNAVLEQYYRRLRAMFDITFSSFERKRYSNLSHEANKAMNLNSYIALIGKSWKEVQVAGGLELRQVPQEQADFHIPAVDYVNTIDADSIMLPEYLVRMMEVMERPQHHKLAVVQSTVSCIPHSPNALERAAGACLDLQFMNHQGLSHWNATFWVGANAMLRYRALEEIKEIKQENGKSVTVYIQDRTVIEDTESSVDLVEKGWSLYNYPQRLSYSAMPADFGSLLIQRRRWANGGMIILPKLFRYIAKAPKRLTLVKEFLLRFHYLASTTISCILIALMALFHFGDDQASIWLMLCTIPATALYLRVLMISGYGIADLLRISAVNIMLLPVLFGGVLKQFQQMITGTKIPFGRTPKVADRTTSPALYCLAELALAVGFVYSLCTDILQHNWYHAVFCAVNGAFMIYALVVFMGVHETIEDIVNGTVHVAGKIAANAEILWASALRKTRDALVPVSWQA